MKAEVVHKFLRSKSHHVAAVNRILLKTHSKQTPLAVHWSKSKQGLNVSLKLFQSLHNYYAYKTTAFNERPFESVPCYSCIEASISLHLTVWKWKKSHFKLNSFLV